MLKSFIFFLLLSITLLPASIGQNQVEPIRQNTNKKSILIADGAILKLISNKFSFTEGPAVDKKGNIFFTDQPNNTIWQYDRNGKLSVYLKNAGRSNGMYFDQQGNLISCADEHNQLWEIQPDGTIKVLLDNYKGLHFNGPNDLWISPTNGIYFTDPYYQRNYWTRKLPEMDGQKVYYLQQNKEPIIVADNLVQPNGIVGTPDGKYLYVADIGANKTYRYQITSAGKLADQKLFAPMGSDGMTIDESGNIYLTGNGVTIYNKEGELIEHIQVPEEWTGNLTFGGKQNNLLFITASKSVYTMQMKVKGVQ
ncbi:MAG: SMP-30/gluconolactonase/LRE family protein [Bacteroidota bacterium]